MTTAMMLDREIDAFFGESPNLPRRVVQSGKRGPAEREAHMIVMRESGATLEEIGAVFTLTRERVRQLLARNGYGAHSRVSGVDPLAILRLVRNPETTTLVEVAAATGVSAQVVGVVLRQLKMGQAVRRLLQWRRDRIVIDKFVAMAVVLGHTPTALEVGGKGLWQGGIQKRFGGMQNLARRAGLVPNVSGRPMGSRRKSVSA